MKTTSVVASLLLSSLAAAAPLNKRVMATKTNVVTETVVVYTTVWDGQGATEAQATPTSTPGLFYEQSSEQPKPTSVYTPPANTPPAVTPSSSSTQEEPKPQPTTSSTSTYVAPQPTTTKAQTPTAAATTYPAAPAQTTSSGSSSGGSGEVHSGGSITMNYFGGGTGSCGEPIQDSDMAVALASDLFGASTYDPATGNPTNKWCNVKVAITYNGNTQEAVIKDRCEGCTKGGFDMTPALWKAITGGVGGGSGDRLYGATWVALS